jgi:hypothetical protein
MQLAKIVCMVTLDEVDLLQINPPMDFVSQMITPTSDIASDTHQDFVSISSFVEDNQQEFTPSSFFAKDTQWEKIGMNSSSYEQTQPAVEVNNYHLIFNLIGVLVATSEGQTKSHLVVLRPSLKEFLSTCVKKFMVYIWSSTMKRNFSKHLDIITEKIGILLSSSRILDQSLCFKNDHFLPEKLDKLVFHKNLKHFFCLFPSITFEITLLVDNMLHKNMFNPLYSAIFFKTFYGSHINSNHLLDIVLLYLESLHFSGMQVYKFVELNPFGSITDVALGEPWYEK